MGHPECILCRPSDILLGEDRPWRKTNCNLSTVLKEVQRTGTKQGEGASVPASLQAVPIQIDFSPQMNPHGLLWLFLFHSSTGTRTGDGGSTYESSRNQRGGSLCCIRHFISCMHVQYCTCPCMSMQCIQGKINDLSGIATRFGKRSTELLNSIVVKPPVVPGSSPH